MPKTVILISGYKRSGKDYTATRLSEAFTELGITSEIHAFAAPMKQIIATTFGISMEELNDYKNKSERFFIRTDDSNTQHNLHTTDYRSILQRFGTEAMKPVFGEDVWGNLMADKISNSYANVIIIPDFRYDRERHCIGRIMGTSTLQIRIEGGEIGNDYHTSEILPTSSIAITLDNTNKSKSYFNEIGFTTTDIANLIKSKWRTEIAIDAPEDSLLKIVETSLSGIPPLTSDPRSGVSLKYTLEEPNGSQTYHGICEVLEEGETPLAGEIKLLKYASEMYTQQCNDYSKTGSLMPVVPKDNQ